MWWPNAFPSQPWNTWFWANRPGSPNYYPSPGSANPFWEWAPGMYWFFKIPSSSGHKEQLAFKTPEYRVDQGGNHPIYPNAVYIITYPGDTPNWEGSASAIEIGAPCGNWASDEWQITWTTRNQTIETHAAIRVVRENPFTLSSIIAITKDKNAPIDAYIEDLRSINISEHAAINGNRENPVPIHAAVRSDVDVYPIINACVSKDFDEIIKISAYDQGNPLVWSWLTATILGETQISVGLTALILIDRTNQILIEMENLGIQERDIRSVPNWASKTVDWRKTSLEKEYGDL